MRIVAVDCRTVRWPIASVGAARGVWSERIAAVITVTDELGHVGLGEAAPLPGLSIDAVEDAQRAAADLASRMPIVMESPAHATGIADRITAAPAARFALETALLAAYAQRARTSIAGLWSPMPQAELRYAVVVDDEAEAIVAVLGGARCLKIKVATAADLERARRISAAAPTARLRLDANRQWPRSSTLAWMSAIRDLPIDYIEEPCADTHELLALELPCRIALDESLVGLGRAELARAVASPQLAALVLKPTLLGGFARCFELAAFAHRHGVAPVISHALEGPIGHAACVELARAIGADVPVGLAPHPALARFWEHA